MSEEDIACNYESLQDHELRIKELEHEVKALIINVQILWDCEKKREQSQ